MRMMALALLATTVLAAPAAATSFPLNGSLLAQFYTVTSGGNGDFDTQCCSTRPNMVSSVLGPNRRPVYNPDGGPAIKGVDALTNEIQWWTPGTTAGGDAVTLGPSAIVPVPFTDTSFFPPNGTGGGNGNGFLTAHFTGNLNLGRRTLVTANVGADDDAFVFINRQLVAGLGGVHAIQFSPQGSILLGPGTYQMDVFFADRFQTQSSLQFSFTGSYVPEPQSWAMLIAGFGLVGATMRRRRSAITPA